MSTGFVKIGQFMVVRLALIALVGLSGLAVAGMVPAPKKCQKFEERAAGEISGALATWAAVHDAYQRFAHCDDGGIGEGFSESISNLLAYRWAEFKELSRFAQIDKQFEAFVLKHIDTTVPEERLNAIFENAMRRCESGVQLCKKIAQSAELAQREISADATTTR